MGKSVKPVGEVGGYGVSSFVAEDSESCDKSRPVFRIHGFECFDEVEHGECLFRKCSDGLLHLYIFNEWL